MAGAEEGPGHLGSAMSVVRLRVESGSRPKRRDAQSGVEPRLGG